MTRQAYRFALDPSVEQGALLASFAGASRFWFNAGLALVKERLDLRAAGEAVRVPWSYRALCSEFKGDAVKDELAPWRSQVPVGSYQAGLEALGKGAQELHRGASSRPPRGVPRVPCQGSLPRVGHLPAPPDRVGASGRVRPAAGPDPYQGADVEADPAARARRTGAHHACHGQPLGRELVRQLYGRALAQAAPRPAPGRSRRSGRRPDPAGDAVGRAAVQERAPATAGAVQGGAAPAAARPAAARQQPSQLPARRARQAGRVGLGEVEADAAHRGPPAPAAGAGREPPPRAGPSADHLPDTRVRSDRCGDPERAWPAGQPPAGTPHRRRRLGHDPDAAEVQDLLVGRLPSGRRRPFLSLLEDLLGLRDRESEAGPVRARLQL